MKKALRVCRTSLPDKDKENYALNKWGVYDDQTDFFCLYGTEEEARKDYEDTIADIRANRSQAHTVYLLEVKAAEEIK